LAPVSRKPLLSRQTTPSSHSVCGSAPIKIKQRGRWERLSHFGIVAADGDFLEALLALYLDHFGI
jgi:hypothetical protein